MPAKSRPKTHKHKPAKFSQAEVHKLHKYFMKKDKAPSMKFRRGRTGKGMYGGAIGDSQDFSYDDKAGREQEEEARQMQQARALIAQGASMKEVQKKFPGLR